MRKTFSLPVAATAAGGGPTPPPADTVDNIEHSVRLNSADSAQLTKTFSSAGNTETNTISLWVKRNKISYALDTYQSFLSAGNNFIWHFDTADRLGLYQGGFIRYTTQKFRDPSAWYHFVFATDTTQSAASDQIKVYVNGQLITDWDVETALTQNTTLTWNSNVLHNIGSNNNTQYPDIQIADVQSIDGQALTPSSFGFTDSNGVWQPKAYTGSYGTNGFHLDFADTSSATALGNDVSGNNNDFTPSGLVAGPAYTANSFSTEFDGTDDYLSIPDDPSLDLGTDDYTVEAWIYPAAVSGLKEILTKGHGFQVYHNGTSLSLAVSSDGSTYDIASSFGTIAANQWYHIAVTRSGNTTRAFLNGTLGLTDTASTTIHNNTDAFVIADYGPSLVYGFNGKVSNVRVIKGRALYTAAFTPPTTALTAVTDTVLLTCQDSTFIDNSASAHTITANNGAATTTVSPFEPVDGSDAMLDSPTNYGSGDTVRGNYATWNPLDIVSGTFTVSDGNLTITGTSNAEIRATFAISSFNKCYYEVTAATTISSAGYIIGALPHNSSTKVFSWKSGGSSTGLAGNPTLSTYTTNDVLGVAIDTTATTVELFKNGVSEGTYSYTDPGVPYLPAAFLGNNDSCKVNFGQQPFKYPAPSGYKSLCSTNLPTPAVADGSTAMDVVTYTGNGGTQTISTPNLSPDLIWLKRRSATSQHVLTDIVRGTNSQLYSSSTTSEGSDTTAVTAFNSAGFELGSGPVSFGNTNTLNSTYVGWVWDAGSSTVSNTDGAITSQVRANPTAGISVVSYTGTLTAAGNTTVGHGLSNAPALVITKGRNETATWIIQSSALGANEYLQFSTAAAQSSTAVGAGALPKPTSSVFYTSWLSGLGGNGINHIAYCFAPVEGFSAFGSYVGDGSSSNGPFVYTGMRPKWIMIKDTTGSTNHWVIYDTERDTYNESGKRLAANLADKEGESNTLGSGIGGIDILSNGFKIDIAGGNHNALNSTYIYAAFAEQPFKTSRAR